MPVWPHERALCRPVPSPLTRAPPVPDCCAQAVLAAYNFDQHAPWLVPHSKDPDLMFCTVTRMPVSRQPKTVEGHVKGKRFQRMLAASKSKGEVAAAREARREAKRMEWEARTGQQGREPRVGGMGAGESGEDGEWGEEGESADDKDEMNGGEGEAVDREGEVDGEEGESGGESGGGSDEGEHEGGGKGEEEDGEEEEGQEGGEEDGGEEGEEEAFKAGRPFWAQQRDLLSSKLGAAAPAATPGVARAGCHAPATGAATGAAVVATGAAVVATGAVVVAMAGAVADSEEEGSDSDDEVRREVMMFKGGVRFWKVEEREETEPAGNEKAGKGGGRSSEVGELTGNAKAGKAVRGTRLGKGSSAGASGDHGSGAGDSEGDEDAFWVRGARGAAAKAGASAGKAAQKKMGVAGGNVGRKGGIASAPRPISGKILGAGSVSGKRRREAGEERVAAAGSTRPVQKAATAAAADAVAGAGSVPTGGGRPGGGVHGAIGSGAARKAARREMFLAQAANGTGNAFGNGGANGHGKGGGRGGGKWGGGGRGGRGQRY